ncbi:hypothetical protein [Saccharothrix sp. Mg75]|uniref:hypothetical protein n=1 Tax=Saccharothrix sp. Mg75 TaxID=3445357 RepID=UPI003EF03B8F
MSDKIQPKIIAGVVIDQLLTNDTGDQTRPHTVTETPTGGGQVTRVFTRAALGVTESVDNGQRTGCTCHPIGVTGSLEGVPGPPGQSATLS